MEFWKFAKAHRGKLLICHLGWDQGAKTVENISVAIYSRSNLRLTGLNQPYTNEVNQHTPSGWCVYSKFANGDVDDPLSLYRGKDCIETFYNYIKGEAHRLYHMFHELPMDPLTKKQWKKYKKATKCHLCYKPFTLRDPKVRDHCRYTGLYRGPAHSLCNLRYKIPSYIPVVFHNLSG